MTLFWVVAVLFLAAALLFVIPPLFRRSQGAEVCVDREAINVTIYQNQLKELALDLASGDVDQAQYDKSKEEIERRLLEDAQQAAEEGEGQDKPGLTRFTAFFVALAVPLSAIGLYSFGIGNPGAINPPDVSMVAQQNAADAHGDETNMAAQLEQMIGGLAERLEENPADIQGWVMLGRSYSVVGQYDMAVSAFSKAVQLAGDDPGLLTDYADALAMNNNESLEGKPMEMLQRALVSDPSNQKALWLVGTGLFERGDFGGAIEHWTRLLSLMPADSEDANLMRGNIQEARSYQARQARGEFGPASTPTTAAATDKVPSAVSGTVALSPELLAQAAPEDTVFIYAKAVSGPPMPLAIIRARVSDLPMNFVLDETMAMMPTMSLANFPDVMIGARVSKTGEAIAQSGDFEAKIGPVAVGSRDLNLMIGSVVP